QLGSYHRKSASQHTVDGTAAVEESEDADYGSFKVSAVRYKDSTEAYAAALKEANRPLQAGNYLIACTGSCPKNLAALVDSLPHISHAPVPTLTNYLPSKGLVAYTERYILGPADLQEAASQIPESAVGFQFGTEGELARYRIGRGEAIVAVFSYPTPGLARQQ